eukprot:CAMPEP_0115145318 /NCGR_PEP_ID=MMETSP0227-20121206/62040_1 /TAXON_ID=89957 /ORGANISM="Polarella glacialis, Strain CCMP 1383" /LENGTH=65 /DNA_ID=CAMNT_0002554805 /DNA_START=1213 /DNA_END=1410 /DNA_ORIENTATION=-
MGQELDLGLLRQLLQPGSVGIIVAERPARREATLISQLVQSQSAAGFIQQRLQLLNESVVKDEVS